MSEINIINAGKQIQWEIDLEQVQDKIISNDAELFKSVIRNLLSNSVKHCLQKPKIEILGLTDSRSWSIKISDNAGGFSDEQLQEYAAGFGVSRNSLKYKNSKGFGMQMIRDFSDKCGCRVHFENTQVGASTQISFDNEVDLLK